MIKNQRQYEITKAQINRFEKALASLSRDQEGTNVHPRLKQAERESLEAQLQDLRAEVEAFDSLKAGDRAVLTINSLMDLPAALIQARIAGGLGHRELAEKLGMKEQQIQRYEATNYAGASLDRLQAVAEALGIAVREDLFLPTPAISLGRVFKTANQVGIDRDLIRNRLMPSPERYEDAEGDTRAAIDAASNLARVFGGSTTAWFGMAPMPLSSEALAGVRFKVTASANQARLSAYTVYAHYLALLVLQATEHINSEPVPTEPTELRNLILDKSGQVTFSSVLDAVWKLGIPVLPLKDVGAFHGACWRVAGRNVIVLKQRTMSDARWVFDLLHEVRHAGEEPGSPEFSVIELDVNDKSRWKSLAERMASAFAGAVALGSNADELATLSVQRAHNSMERLKTAVTQVAQEEHVRPAALANHLAFRLSLQGQNWWGAAHNLQDIGENPWAVARDKLILNLDFGRLAKPDRDLLSMALIDLEDAQHVSGS